MKELISPLPLAELRSIERSEVATRLTDLPVSPAARILFLAPHPDDFDSVAITLKRFLDNGNAIHLVVLTGGAAGVLDSFVTPPTDERKVQVREHEQKEALRFFGLPLANVVFLHRAIANDGELLVDDACRVAVAEILQNFDPDIVFVPHQEDTNNGHRRACALFREIASGTTKPLWALYHKDPKTIRIRIGVYTPFNGVEAEWKRDLLRHHRSQHTRNLQTRGSGFDDRILNVNESLATELGAEEGFAEGFQTEVFLPKPVSKRERTLTLSAQSSAR
jgi:LmbE family N-acetylglucosaminyl deacetylase